MEVMRDRADNCVIICSIENLDPMGVHTGDSITVAPIQTLTDKEYPDHARRLLRGHPRDRRRDRRLQHPVRRQPGQRPHDRHRDEPARLALPALASKATGFPIAKIAAKLAVGYTLDELQQRHHPRDARLLRADHRLRASSRFRASPSRNSPQADADADHADEIASARRWPSAARSRKRCKRRCAVLEIKRFGLLRRSARRQGPDRHPRR